MRRDDTTTIGFDAAGAQGPTRVLRVQEIVDLLPISHAPERIEEYRLAMQRGDRFPPIAVVRCGRRFFIADGHKRFSAYLELQRDEIVVEIWPPRRWLRDQWQQFVSKTRQQVRVLGRGGRTPQARREAARLLWDTVGHWRRIWRSLRAVRHGGAPPAPE